MNFLKIYMNKNTILDVKNLYKKIESNYSIFSKPKQYYILSNINFDLKFGETLGVVGESGSGKTTLAKCLVKLITPDSGKIYYQQKRNNSDKINILELNRNSISEIRKDIQIIFQDPFTSLNPKMRINQIVSHPIKFHKLFKNKNDFFEKAEDLLTLTGINKDLFDNYPHQLSGGQRQRVGIARSLALNPKILIADEPVSALDVSIQAQIINLLKKLQTIYNLSIIFISHDLSVIKYVSDKIIVMYLGEIVEAGNTVDIFKKPLHPYTEALINSIPKPSFNKNEKSFSIIGEVPSIYEKPKGCKFHPRCFYAEQKCKNDIPELITFNNNHSTSCHLSNKLKLKGL